MQILWSGLESVALQVSTSLKKLLLLVDWYLHSMRERDGQLPASKKEEVFDVNTFKWTVLFA